MSSLLFKFYIIFLILLIINNCNSSRIKIQRNLNRYTSTPKPVSTLKEENELLLDENEDESPLLRLIRSFKQKQQKKKKQKEVKQKEVQCWIRINKKLGEFYYEHGKCECLYDNKFVCIGEKHIDPYNYYCEKKFNFLK
uniref:Uncharacterized protein n=1 Tax=Meloidogyne enterolobii TaxID=390850 RepID=A0A6V7TW03_MELEN|nr:unnamed protein product [Meloidogyne enterolobii]